MNYKVTVEYIDSKSVSCTVDISEEPLDYDDSGETYDANIYVNGIRVLSCYPDDINDSIREDAIEIYKNYVEHGRIIFVKKELQDFLDSIYFKDMSIEDRQQIIQMMAAWITGNIDQ